MSSREDIVGSSLINLDEPLSPWWEPARNPTSREQTAALPSTYGGASRLDECAAFEIMLGIRSPLDEGEDWLVRLPADSEPSLIRADVREPSSPWASSQASELSEAPGPACTTWAAPVSGRSADTPNASKCGEYQPAHAVPLIRRLHAPGGATAGDGDEAVASLQCQPELADGRAHGSPLSAGCAASQTPGSASFDAGSSAPPDACDSSEAFYTPAATPLPEGLGDWWPQEAPDTSASAATARVGGLFGATLRALRW